MICISGSELLVRVTATGAVVGTVYDAGRSELRGVYELGDDLIVVLESPYIKRLNFNPPLYPEIDTYNYIAGISEVIPYLVMIFCIEDIVANTLPNLLLMSNDSDLTYMIGPKKKGGRNILAHTCQPKASKCRLPSTHRCP